ncbi:MAG: hypothetical protein RLZ37_1822 [Actinomycetota bacterium]
MSDERWLDWDWHQAHKTERRVLQPVQGLFERVKADPNSPILSSGDRIFTTEEFARMASSIAARLVDSGEETPVVVLVDRSPTSTASILGVEWSSRCLVTVGADEPLSRLESIIDRVGPCTIANASDHTVKTVAGREVVDLTKLPDRWIDPIEAPADRQALIVFTSGSTGQPKGVIWSRWQIDVTVHDMRLWSSLRTAVFGPLQWLLGICGVHQAMHDNQIRLIDAARLGPREIMSDLRQFGVERLFLTASLLQSLAAEVDRSRPFDTLREALLLGEAAKWESVRSARSLSTQGVVAVSMYGASELVRNPTRIEVHPHEDLETGLLPMGKLSGDWCELDPVGVGDEGLYEIVIKKWIVDGYLGDDELQSQRFAFDEDGDRLWRSGDVVSVDADGVVHYRGRSDDMVKVSGKLIEPSESARVIGSCPGIVKVVVLPRTLPSGKKQLVAHVEASPEASVVDVRSRLVAELPAHLIPAAIVRHNVLPVTERGKVDRLRLNSEPVVPWRGGPVVEPRDEVERIVVREASSLLGLDVVSVEDELWSFGLDSLGAIELCEVLARALSPGLTVNDFLGASTPALIARRLVQGRRVERSHAVSLVEGDRPAVFMVTGGGGPALNLRALATKLGSANLSVNGLDAGWGVVAFEQWGLMQRRRPDRSVRASAVRNLEYVRQMGSSDHPVLIGHSWGGLVAHEMAIELSGQGVHPLLVLLDSGRPVEGMEDFIRPADLHVRNRSWPLYVARLVYWRFHRLLAPVGELRRSDRRFTRLLRHAARVARRHEVGVFGGPTLLVCANGSSAGEKWRSEPNLRVVHVAGGHNTMLQPPYVDETTEKIQEFISESQAPHSPSQMG